MTEPTATQPVTVATYTDYPTAQRAVDYLSDNGFPVDRVSIVGTNVRLVENVLGRLTTGRAAAAGALSGGWFGLFVGLLLSIFTTGSSWWAVLVAAVLIGVVWGAIFGGVGHAMTRGQRDFTSVKSLEAAEYGISVPADLADEARAQLTRMTWNASQSS
ncbi:general stress protein [Luedemannella helvata]|uniref:General stress protein 17M-like domain-containing protein n=1 Tax=Luedemannella helvata TaxID=349315 RepID=A0ABN2L6X4_9ACTN